jgi:hypothetical protein
MNIFDAILPFEPVLQNYPISPKNPFDVNHLPLTAPCKILQNEPLGWSSWILLAIETSSWVNKLFILRERTDLLFPSSILSVEMQSQPFCHYSTNPNVYFNWKCLYWAAILMRLSSFQLLEKKKEISFWSVLLRDGLKMETNAVRLFYFPFKDNF